MHRSIKDINSSFYVWNCCLGKMMSMINILTTHYIVLCMRSMLSINKSIMTTHHIRCFNHKISVSIKRSSQCTWSTIICDIMSYVCIHSVCASSIRKGIKCIHCISSDLLFSH